jgi:hypothetical protein
MPRSVICSPSHMMKAVPAVSEMTVRSLKPQPGWRTTCPTDASAPEFDSADPMLSRQCRVSRNSSVTI